jgi:hypothetical protein
MFLVTTAWRVLRLRKKEMTFKYGGKWEYIDIIYTGSRHVMVLQLGVRCGTNNST